MSSLTENGVLQELSCGANLAYVLAKDVKIQPTEYKVMQNANSNCLVKCMRMKYNGQDELYYLTAGMKSFLNVLLSSDPDNAANLIAALLKSVVELKNTGFLTCTSIDSALQRIYVDFHTNRVRLIYLPIDRHFYPDDITFENEFRSALVRRIDEIPGGSPKLSKIRQALINATCSLENFVGGAPVGGSSGSSTLSGGSDVGGYTPPPEQPPVSPTNGPRLILTAVNAPTPVRLVVDCAEFRIGKNPELEGVVTFNKYIGRLHCKIIRANSGFSVIDLDSKNGTFINRGRLTPQQPYALKSGDILRLANSDFQVSIS